MKSWNYVKLVGVMTLILALLFLAGCGAKDTLGGLKDRFAGETLEEEEQAPEIETIEPPTEDVLGETVEVMLYFSDPTGTELVSETREIPKVEGIGRETIEQLISGPRQSESELLPTIPMGTELLDINVKEDGLARLDFSRELMDNHLGGSTAENLTVYSIVNTLAQFPTVDRVQILVEGQYVDAVAGHVDVSVPLEPNYTMVLAQDESQS